MTESLNGWPGLPDGDPRIHTAKIPGLGREVTLARACMPLVLHFLAAWHKEMTPRMKLFKGPIDGWEYRNARQASGSLSNHGSGTAVDVLYTTVLPADGQKHMTPAELRILDRILSRYVCADGHRVLANGEWWRRADGMHTELSQGWDRCALRDTTAADVAYVIRKLRIQPDGTTRTLTAHMLHLLHLKRIASS